MEKYPYSAEEPESMIKLDVDNKNYFLQPHNTELFRHLGRYAIYDHIYHMPDEEGKGYLYIFSSAKNFEDIVEAMFDLKFPMHFNLQSPLESDMEVFEEQFKPDIDEIPSWLPEV